MSPVKEPAFFAFKDMERIPTIKGLLEAPSYSYSWEGYCELFQGASEELRGEASAFYLYFPEAPRRIYEYIPNSKLIAILRNPVERAFSQYLLYSRDGAIKNQSFADALTMEENSSAKPAEAHFLHYKKYGLYAEQLRRYFEVFNKDQLRVYLHEDLVTHPRAVTEDVLRFLGADTGYLPRQFAQFNPGSGNLRYEKLWRAVSAIARHKYTKTLVPDRLRKSVSERIRDWKRQAMKPTARPVMDHTIKESLVDYYRDDILELQELIGRDLSQWLD